MSSPLTADELLNQSFLELRARLLDVGAALDRIERADAAGTLADDPRWQRLREATELLLQGSADRAERIQMLFSDDYVPNWK